MHSRVTITGDINSSQTGNYEIIYSVVDIAGNVSESVKRTVVTSDEVLKTRQLVSGRVQPLLKWILQNWLGQFMPFSSG